MVLAADVVEIKGGEKKYNQIVCYGRKWLEVLILEMIPKIREMIGCGIHT